MEKINNLISKLLFIGALMMLSGAAFSVEHVTYFHNDQLGSPVVATDSSGNVVWHESYEPYGNRDLHEGDNQNSLWFTGKQEERIFGISNFGARWYDPDLGRFLSIDPVGASPDKPSSFNRYAYANNNPYRYVDLDGNLSIDVVLNKNRHIAGTIHIYDDFGSEIKLQAPIPYRSATALGYATSRNTLDKNGDTPTGEYSIQDTVVSSSTKEKSSYGPMRIRLDPISGDALIARILGRIGIDIHGGDSVSLPGRTGLKQTYGCVRVSNKNIELINNIVENNRAYRNSPEYARRKMVYGALGITPNQNDVLRVREK